MKASILFLGLIIALLPSSIVAQKNRIMINTSPVHYFFDNNPVINLKYNRPGGRFIYLGGWGLVYSREIDSNSRISAEVVGLTQAFKKHTYAPLVKPAMVYRAWSIFKINYTRVVRKNKIAYLFGGGVNYTHGIEGVATSSVQIYNETYFASVEAGTRRDFGLNAFAGLEYKLKGDIFMYSKIDLLSIVYINDKNYKKNMREVYNSPQFPGRFDLSLTFGIGFSF